MPTTVKKRNALFSPRIRRERTSWITVLMDETAVIASSAGKGVMPISRRP